MHEEQRASGTTFEEACEGWINKHKPTWRSLKNVKILLGHAQPLAHMPLRTIDKRKIIDALADLNKRHPSQKICSDNGRESRERVMQLRS